MSMADLITLYIAPSSFARPPMKTAVIRRRQLYSAVLRPDTASSYYCIISSCAGAGAGAGAASIAAHKAPKCNEQQLRPAPSSNHGHDALVRLQLPAPVNCVFPVRRHPQYESVKEECDQWSLSFFDPPSFLQDSVRQAYFQSVYPLLPASAYSSPRVSRQRLLLVCKISFCLFMLDDAIDDADAQTAAVLANSFLAVLTSTSSASSPAPAAQSSNTSDARIQRFMERLRTEVWEDMCRGMPPDLQRRYVRECVRSMEALKEMWHFRRQCLSTTDTVGRHLNASGMMALRLLDGFCWPFTTLLEYALGIELPDPAGKTSMGGLVQKMIKAAGTHALCVNEVFSYGKELLNKDAQSMVSVLVAERRAAEAAAAAGSRGGAGDVRADMVEEVMCEVWKIVQEQERKCVDLLLQIRSLAREDEEGDLINVIYAEALGDFISGHMWWTTRTGRYHGPHAVPWNTSPSFLTVDPSLPKNPLNFLTPPDYLL